MARRQLDQTTDYASRVVDGRIVAGPHVRAACRRHLDDLNTAHGRGYVFNVDVAERAIRFFPTVLRLNGGGFEGDPFTLQPWQAFVVGAIFGWVRADNGLRRFRVAYVETGKGSGKSPLAAGIGLYMLLADNEARAEVYAAATKRDQAMILFRDAVAMFEQSERLRRALTPSGKNPVWNLAHMRSGSWFRTLSADKAQSGPRPHCGLIDELHEHPDGTVLELLRAGTKGRSQPLMFMITNAGASQHSACWEYHVYGTNVAAGMLVDDEFFSYVCALDDGDDPFVDEACWIKTNPTLGVTIKPDYLRAQVREAVKIPSKESLVRRLHFCQWTNAASPWLSYELWRDATDLEFDPQQWPGRRAWGGLDLSATTDLTAFVLALEPVADDPVWRLLPYCWLPDRGLEDKAARDRVPYVVWRDHGHLLTTDSAAIDRRSIVHQLRQIAQHFTLVDIAYDRHDIESLKTVLDEQGLTLPMGAHGQGFVSMSPALRAFETLLLNGELKHPGNPVLTWCAANAVIVEDDAGNRKLSKAKATGRIDGIVAGVMAVGNAARRMAAASPSFRIEVW